ncbi:MAG: rod shape-determining protein RodA [Firmicutes bacterium]|nr:rod shape-determining protein RodA [Bacillota bacterium]
MFDKKMIKNVDWLFVGLLLVLLGTSLFVLASASGNLVASKPYYFVQRQAVWMLLGVLVAAAVAWFNYRDLEKWTKPAYALMLMLLVAVLLVPPREGVEAARWLYFGSFTFQPSELGKLVVIVSLAAYLARNQHRIKDWRVFWGAIALTFVPMLLILKEPDLGTSLVFGFIMVVMMWLAGIPRKRVLVLLLIVFLLVGVVFVDLWFATDGFTHLAEDLPLPLPMRTYQLNRLIIFINPEMDPTDAGYQIIQSKVAIGSGGLLGKGYGEGSQVQNNFLPTHHTDFIYAVVGEELGFIGSLFVLLLYVGLLLRAVRIALSAGDLFGSLIVSGIVAMLLFQIYTNIGMTIGLMPITGITLPFFSYGGTSLLINMVAVGLILSVNIRSSVKLF